jgi:hypothetical protein
MIQKTFNLSKTKKNLNDSSLDTFAGRKPIKDRGILWKEKYHEKSASLKKRFDKDIGPGAYIRWEGHDYTTGHDYYVVVGPTIQKELGKCFFAGVKKLPKDKKKKAYSPYGEYFPNLFGALSYATQKWGVRFPVNQPNYTQANLAIVDIPEHIKG